MNKNNQDQDGFTLIEILIVVILLGILATVILPQVKVSSDDAKLATLKTNLYILRKAVQRYYFEHDKLYPGLKKLPGGGIETKPGNYFRKQLTRYTALDGSANKTKDATYKFGPYFKGEELPINPFDDSNDVKTNHTETDITVRNSSGEKGWKFYTQTGVLIANDGSHDNL